MGEIWRRLAYFFRRDRFARDLDDEMRLHVELRARKLHDVGVSDPTAAARRQFGNRTVLLESSAELWGWGAWERLVQDFRMALRTLGKTPAFTVVAVLTLALGLGINTAVFSVVNAVMIRRLPYVEPGRLVSVWGEFFRNPPPGFVSPEAKWGGPARTNHSVAEFLDFRRDAHSFESLAAFRSASGNLTGAGTPERIQGESVTASFLPVLGVLPAQGRNFDPEEDRAGASPVIILTHGFWERRLGGDRAILDRSVILDGKPHRVIGVLPPGFESPGQFEQKQAIEYYVPAAFTAKALADYGSRSIRVIGRLKPRVALAAAQADLDAVSAALAKEHSQHTNFRSVATPLQDDIVRHVGNPLLALLGASGLIVLITCVNVANLLLVRAAARRHETSVRFALGASRLRVVRQFLAESMVVAAAGCAAGIVLGQVLLRLLLAIAPGDLPRLAGLTADLTMDWRVFAVATAVATVTGIAFGVTPAWQASRTRPVESLKATARNTGSPSQSRWRSVLTIAEVALAMVLTIGAGLLLKSFVRLMGVDLGFEPDRVLAINVNLPNAAYGTREKRLRFFEQLAERVQVLPGVQSAAFANSMPLRGGWSTGIRLDISGETNVGTDAQAVSPGYFATMGIPLLQGRLLTAGDRDGQPLVVVVNREFVRRFLPNVDPIGRRLRWDEWVTIVGVVSDIRRSGKEQPVRPGIYVPAEQSTASPVTLSDFAVRASGDPRRLVSAIQAQVWELDRNQPVTGVQTLAEMVSVSVSQRRFETLLLLAFAAVAVGLAVIGVFGVLSYTVSQRTPEWGVRIALGAAPSSILRLVIRQAGWLVAAGVSLGLCGAFALTRFLESMLFEVHRNDAATYLACVALLAVVAIAASLIPARRGSRVDPMVALRYE